MAKLKVLVDKLDDVEEPFRGLYVETEDKKFRLDADIEDVTGLKNSVQATRKERDEAQKQIQAWKKLGKTPEEIEALLAQQEEAERTKAEKAGEWDKLKVQMNEKHQQELAKREDEIKKRDAQIERLMIESTATQAIAAAEGVPTLLLPHIKASTKILHEDGQYSVRVVDDKGNPRVNGKGDFLTIADLVEEMKKSEVFGVAFKAKGGGGGAPPAGGGGGNPPAGGKPRSKMTQQEKSAYIAEHGQAAYLNLPMN